MTKATVRSCVACGEEASKADLVRFALGPDGAVTPDLHQRLPGRGVYLHPDPACFTDAEKRKAFNRAFRRQSLDFNAKLALALVLRLVDDDLAATAGLCRKVGLVVSGSRAIDYRLRHCNEQPSPSLVLLAEDAAEGRRARLESACREKDIEIMTLFSGADWGTVLGTDPRSAVLLLHGGLTDRFRALAGLRQRLLNHHGQ